MRHGDRVKHLGRPADQRKALIRSLVTEVLRHGQIRTTKVQRGVKRTGSSSNSSSVGREACAALRDQCTMIKW